jgi:hypothetical protein
MSKEYKNPKGKVIALNTVKRPASAIKAPHGIHYYDLRKKWRKVKPHLGDPELNNVLVRDMNKFTQGRRGD